MELALYAAGLGYYSAGARKFGEAGDFTTAPELSPLFSRCLARQCAQALTACGADTLLELGAGSGVMAAEMLLELERIQALPARYLIMEVSADLAERQAETLAQRAPHLANRVHWLDTLPDADLNAVVIGNEVLDALPVERFRIGDDGSVEQARVVFDDGDFSEIFAPAPEALVHAVRAVEKDLGAPLAPGYTSEILLQLEPFVRSLAGMLERGVILFADYGLPRREYYLDERRTGTLMCHYRHRAHPDPFILPGLQDITAYVDFTAVADAGVNSDLALVGYTSQALFLLGAGIEKFLAEPAADEREQIERARQVKLLTLPGEMGERFKFIALAKGCSPELSGFGIRDLAHLL
jgi:SAM-dependent MidA family methyltransferase